MTFALASCDSGAESEGEEEETEESTEDEEASVEEESNAVFTANSESQLKIDGMMCSKGCKGAIEACLNEKEGVTEASVNFEEGTATIAFDNEAISEDEIIEAINTLNEGAYSASVEAATEAAVEETAG